MLQSQLLLVSGSFQICAVGCESAGEPSSGDDLDAGRGSPVPCIAWKIGSCACYPAHSGFVVLHGALRNVGQRTQ